MIEQGFVKLVQTGLASVFTSPAVPGGYAMQLPKDLIGNNAGQVPKAWVYQDLSGDPAYTLGGQDGMTGWQIRIHCHGLTAADAIDLYRAIDNILRGAYAGTLTDTDSTVVRGIFREPGLVSGFSDTDRTYVRSVDYLIKYEQI